MPKKKDGALIQRLSSGILDALAATDAKLTSIPAPPPGIYEDVPMEVYLLWDAISNSQLSLLARSPAHLLAAKTHPRPQTPAQKIGTAAHCAVLEPAVFAKQYVAADRCTATKKGDGLRCNNGGIMFSDEEGWRCGVHPAAKPKPGLTILTGEEYALCCGVQKSLLGHERAALLTGRGYNELSMVWVDRETGLTCKARLDRIALEIAGGAIIDLKSTQDARRRAFALTIYKYGYHRQGAWYTPAARDLGLPVEHYVMLPFEKEPPYACNFHRLGQATLDAGEAEVRHLLRLAAECREKGEWPLSSLDYPTTVEDIEIPDWAWSQVVTGDEYGA